MRAGKGNVGGSFSVRPTWVFDHLTLAKPLHRYPKKKKINARDPKLNTDSNNYGSKTCLRHRRKIKCIVDRSSRTLSEYTDFIRRFSSAKSFQGTCDHRNGNRGIEFFFSEIKSQNATLAVRNHDFFCRGYSPLDRFFLFGRELTLGGGALCIFFVSSTMLFLMVSEART